MLRRVFVAIALAVSFITGFAFAEEGDGDHGGGGGVGQTTDTVSLAVNLGSPQGSALKPWQWTTVTWIDVKNSNPMGGTVAQISELWVTRKGTATDNDLSDIYVYYQNQTGYYWIGWGYFDQGKAFIIFGYFPIFVPDETITLFFETAPRDTAQDGATFALGIESPEDFKVINSETGDPASAFNVVGTPIYGNEFLVDNPPKPSLEAWLDDYEYGPKDAMTLTAEVQNPTETDMKIRLKRWLSTESGSPISGTVKSFIFLLPAHQENRRVLFYTKDLPAVLKPGYYYWAVEMYNQDGAVLDRTYIWWQFIK